jgi:hypothetical protein
VSWVVDASIAVKWVIPEVLSDQADRIRDGDADVLAPDLLLVEVANALWKKTAAKDLTPRGRRGIRPRETKRDRPSRDRATVTQRDGRRTTPGPSGL